MTGSRLFLTFVVSTAAVFTCACTVGPKYRRASVPTPPHWDIAGPWRESAPNDGLLKGDWWTVFHDEDLNALETESRQANQTIKIATARLEQARATAAIQVAAIFPTLSAGSSAERQRISGNRPPNSNFPVSRPVSQDTFLVPFTVSYELDLFGRRRKNIEAAHAAYQASAADFENVRLVVASELAADYFSLRQIDTESDILNHTVEALEKGLQLVDSRHKGGLVSGLDVAQEETFLNTARTQATLLTSRRKQTEDAIAVLVGRPAPGFSVAKKDWNAEPPAALNIALPSDLLERRPDIAEAERQMAAANAQIGVAQAAYYPSLNLFAQGGWQAADIAKLINVQSTFWAVGANVAQIIFTGGARRAQVQFAKAGYDSNVASYRETVLNAFREVQDNLTALTVLRQAQQSQQQAVDAARRSLQIADSRYKGGLANYLDVVNAQQNLLVAQREMAVLRGQTLVTSVLLIKTLGGGWDASSLAAIQVKPQRKDALAP